MKLFNFKQLIDQFTVTFTLEEPKETDVPVEYDLIGNEISTNNDIPKVAKGALVPLPHRVIYQSGGRLTEADRQLYSLDPNIPLKSKITYHGMKYQVESKTPYSDYADFTTYTLKGVDAFD